ncbi:MAG: hypothetical protein WBR18_02020 [Anaerolineales bacterium]
MSEGPKDDLLYQRALQALRQHEKSLLAKPNVLGAGVGVDDDGQHVVVVMVRRKVALEVLSPAERLPDELDGVPVDVRQLGEVNALGQ